MSGHKPETEGNLPATTDTRSDGEKLATSIVPWARDDARARYLGLRASGFTIREALKLIGYVHSALSRWRLDPAFVDIENRLPEYRKELSIEYANLEFVRNYRLVLEKDFRILKHSLHPDTVEVDGKQIPVAMSKNDHEYLIKMRTHYTPQQLQIIQTMVESDGKDNGGYNFTDFVIEASKISERVRIESKGRMPRATEIISPVEDDNG